MDKKSKWSKAGWAVIYIVIAANLFMLYQFKKSSLDTPPLGYLNLDKPTLVVIFNEHECASCVEGLFFLNDMYTAIKGEGRIDFQGIILSKEKKDPKNISKAFIFPIEITDDFNIMRRLNLDKTPVILGITPEHRVIYVGIVPFETGVKEEYIKKGVLDRLYYSLN